MPLNSSDGSTAGVSIIVAQAEQYSDLDLSLTVHPDTHDIVPLTDIDAVVNSVRIILLTNFNEAPFVPDLGSNCLALLFEPADQFTIFALQTYIKTCLQKFEPRVDQITVQVIDDSNNRRYTINLGFRIVQLAQTTQMTVYLTRIR
jgi:phage baseplate assembly protein W